MLPRWRTRSVTLRDRWCRKRSTAPLRSQEHTASTKTEPGQNGVRPLEVQEKGVISSRAFCIGQMTLLIHLISLSANVASLDADDRTLLHFGVELGGNTLETTSAQVVCNQKAGGKDEKAEEDKVADHVA